jgi:hypothetical protein
MTAFPYWRKDEQKKEFVLSPAFLLEKDKMRKDLSFYSQNFVSSDGKDYNRFKEYKHQVNQTKTFIELRIENKSFFLSQKNEGHHAFLRIDQDYRSNNFKSFSRKILYLNKEQGGRIIGEMSL